MRKRYSTVGFDNNYFGFSQGKGKPFWEIIYPVIRTIIYSLIRTTYTESILTNQQGPPLLACRVLVGYCRKGSKNPALGWTPGVTCIWSPSSYDPLPPYKAGNYLSKAKRHIPLYRRSFLDCLSHLAVAKAFLTSGTSGVVPLRGR